MEEQRVHRKVVCLDGEICPADQVKIECTASGFLQGIGLFETLWAGRGRVPWEARRHYLRLEQSSKQWSLLLPIFDQIWDNTLCLRQKLALEQEDVRIRWTLFQVDEKQCKFLITMQKAQPQIREAKVALSAMARHRKDFLTGMKTTSYGGLAQLSVWAKSMGMDEALYVNEAGEIVEGSKSNLFLLHNNKLWTPALASGCLPGITRELVLELAAREKWQICLEPMVPKDLLRCDSAFLTNTQVGILPISELSGRELQPFSKSMKELAGLFEDLRRGGK